MDSQLPPSENPTPTPPILSSADSASTPPPLPPQQRPRPPVLVGPAPAPRRTGFWMVFSFILLFALGLSLLGNLSQFIGEILGSGAAMAKSTKHAQHLTEVVMEDNQSADKILVINLEGVITSSPVDRSGRSMADQIKEQLKLAAHDDAIKGVILRVNSPGGEVLAADDIYQAIVAFQNNCSKPVVASMESMAASGGYYISAPCRWIVANELTITGSIGVIMHGYNYRGLMDKIGLRPEVYKSGKFKNMMSGDRLDGEIPPEEKEMVHSLIMETYERFTNIVAQGRSDAATHPSNSEVKGRMLKADWANYADGRIFSGKQAYELGFVDQLGSFDKAVETTKRLCSVSKADLIQYQEPFNLGKIFSLLGQTESRAAAPTIQVDLGLDLPKLQMGRLYFMAPTTLPR